VKNGIVEWATAAAALPGQSESGDRHALRPVAGGVLAAVVDGLGHGHEAAQAAERALASIEAHPENRSLSELVQHCHAALRGTRGVVMSLAAFDGRAGLLTWIGIGNVEGRLLLQSPDGHYLQESLLLRPGVVGGQLPQLQTSVARVKRGDMLILATDGIDPEFAEHVPIGGAIGDIAAGIISRYGTRTDDGLVLVVRYLG